MNRDQRGPPKVRSGFRILGRRFDAGSLHDGSTRPEPTNLKSVSMLFLYMGLCDGPNSALGDRLLKIKRELLTSDFWTSAARGDRGAQVRCDKYLVVWYMSDKLLRIKYMQFMSQSIRRLRLIAREGLTNHKGK